MGEDYRRRDDDRGRRRDDDRVRRDDDDRGRRDDYDFRKDEYKDDRFRQTTTGGEGGGDDCNSQVMGWVVFILIFGVGNAILYSTTGIFFIPIRR